VTCDEILTLLDLSNTNELPDSEQAQLDAHLDGCSDCRRAQKDFAETHRLLSAMPRYPMPDKLRRKVTDQLRSQSFDSHSSGLGKIRLKSVLTHAAAALLGMAIVAGGSQLGQLAKPSFAEQVVSAHIDALADQTLTAVTSGDRHTVKPWFAGRVDFAPPVIDLQQHQFPLIGGRKVELDGQTMAVLVYQRRKHIIQLFVALDTSKQPISDDLTLRGFQVVGGKRKDFNLWAVSDLSEPELSKFVELIETSP